MKKLILFPFIFLLSLVCISNASAAYDFAYYFNYEKDEETQGETTNEYSRFYHKFFFGASLNRKDTLFLGQNINYWTRNLAQGSNNGTEYSMLELGPRLIYYFSESHNAFVSAEWNPYVSGDRTVATVESELRGSSVGFAIGYRWKIRGALGLGISVHYSKVSFNKSSRSGTETDISDSINFVMPMLEISLLK
jgi:hypothetical protein